MDQVGIYRLLDVDSVRGPPEINLSILVNSGADKKIVGGIIFHLLREAKTIIRHELMRNHRNLRR